MGSFYEFGCQIWRLGSLSAAEVYVRSSIGVLVLVNFADWSGRLVV